MLYNALLGKLSRPQAPQQATGYLGLAVAAAAGEAYVDAEDAVVAGAVDAGLLDGVPHHHSLRARQHSQRLLQCVAVAPHLVLCGGEIKHKHMPQHDAHLPDEGLPSM